MDHVVKPRVPLQDQLFFGLGCLGLSWDCLTTLGLGATWNRSWCDVVLGILACLEEVLGV